MQCTFKVFFTCSMCIARYLRWVQDHTKITPKLIRNQIVTTKRLGSLTTFSKFKWGGLVRGKRGEQRLRLSPFPCRIGYDVWSSTVHTVMQRNVTGTWNFVKKITYFGIRHFIESPSLPSCNTGQGYTPVGGTQQSFTWGGSAPKTNHVAFYIPFLTEKVPSFWQMVPLSHTWFRAVHPLL